MIPTVQGNLSAYELAIWQQIAREDPSTAMAVLFS
jgi:hypothetical protein